MSIAIRRATTQDAPAIAAVRIDSWRNTYRGLIPDAYLDAMQLDQSIALWDRVLSAGRNDTSVFVAGKDGDVIGFAAGNMLKESRYDLDAELSAVYLRREFQRAGVGRRLVAAVASAQREHGAHGLIAWVIAGNKGARAFYERLGGTLLVEQPFEWDGMPLVEAGYGFADIDALVDGAAKIPAPPGSIVH
jgi:GNAT superfamily N-acetyltransferase